MKETITDKLLSFICNSDLHISFFYKSLSLDELEELKNESINLSDSDTVKIIDAEIARRGKK